MAYFALTVFLSSFLLFQVQPVIAKAILPWFGGSAAVWTVCMLFFQAALLGGYAYAHWLQGHGTPARQAKIHIALLVLSLVWLPILPGEAWKPATGENPEFRILLLLAATIGLPYFLLSATSPLLQAWFARSTSGTVPYRLFALSNFASLLALLSYPLLVEPALDIDAQSWIWSGGYALFAACCGAVAWRTRGAAMLRDQEADGTPPPQTGILLLWTALAAAPSVALLAVTTHLTQDVASIPFLWVIPLVLYLLSFVIVFESQRLYARWFWLPLFAAGLGGMLWLAMPDPPEIIMPLRIAATTASLFVACVCCHGELARAKPAPRYLTLFYIAMSVGGVLGGLFVGLYAPAMFPAYHEYPAGWWLAFAAVLAAIAVEKQARATRGWGLAVLLVMLMALGIYGGAWANVQQRFLSGYRLSMRNFYGTLRVQEEGSLAGGDWRRELLHGIINHGHQFLAPARRTEPATYYCRESGVGQAILSRNQFEPVEVGVVGLGTGTLAAYGRISDTYHFFEINPLVPELARREFSYLNLSRSAVKIHMGDARLRMERMDPLGLDVLAVDAFSGDSVPVHLLTREAMALYRRHLRPDGILAVHISNRYLDLEAVVKTAAEAAGLDSVEVSDDRDDTDDVCYGSTWILAFGDAARNRVKTRIPSGQPIETPAGFRVWTDRYSNLPGVLRTK